MYIYIYLVCLVSGKQRDPKKAKTKKTKGGSQFWGSTEGESVAALHQVGFPRPAAKGWAAVQDLASEKRGL